MKVLKKEDTVSKIQVRFNFTTLTFDLKVHSPLVIIHILPSAICSDRRQGPLLYIILTLPCAIAPTTNTTGSSDGTNVFGSTHCSALKDIPIFLHPAGR